MKLRQFGECKEVVSEQYALNLYTLTESVQAHDVLEIGAGWGWSARAFALSLENRVSTRLVSIDLYPKRIHRENREAVHKTDVTWEIIGEDSSIAKPAGQFDVLYIDGNPNLARQDFLRYYPQVRDGGVVIMDGYGGQIGPTESVDSLKQQYPFTPISYHQSYSHAVHRKPQSLNESASSMGMCKSCEVIISGIDWRTIDTAAKHHAKNNGHQVAITIGPRNLSYVVFFKSTPTEFQKGA